MWSSCSVGVQRRGYWRWWNLRKGSSPPRHGWSHRWRLYRPKSRFSMCFIFAPSSFWRKYLVVKSDLATKSINVKKVREKAGAEKKPQNVFSFTTAHYCYDMITGRARLFSWYLSHTLHSLGLTDMRDLVSKGQIPSIFNIMWINFIHLQDRRFLSLVQNVTCGVKEDKF